MSSAFYSFISSITNPITSRYDIKSQVSSSGLWKIYQGERKTTGKKVSLFVRKTTISNRSFFLFLNNQFLFSFLDIREKDFRNEL